MKYIEGDLFTGIVENYSLPDTTTFIPHVCNDINKWGSGFVVPLGTHFPEAKTEFYAYARNTPYLGELQMVQAQKVPVVICNMFAQKGTRPDAEGRPPIRYDALMKCMIAVKEEALRIQKYNKKVIIACPMFGAGLAGGDWPVIEAMILKLWDGLDVNVYYLPNQIPSSVEAVKLDGEVAMVPTSEANSARIMAGLLKNNGEGLDKLLELLSKDPEDTEDWEDLE